MFSRFTKRRGFTLVETLIALALLGVVMLFVTRALSLLSNASENADDIVMESTNTLAITAQLQDVFMQGSSLRVDDNRVIVVTPDTDIDICIENNKLYIDSIVIAPLLRGSLHAQSNSVTFDMVLTNKSFIQTTFYINEGG